MNTYMTGRGQNVSVQSPKPFITGQKVPRHIASHVGARSRARQQTCALLDLWYNTLLCITFLSSKHALSLRTMYFDQDIPFPELERVCSPLQAP